MSRTKFVQCHFRPTQYYYYYSDPGFDVMVFDDPESIGDRHRVKVIYEGKSRFYTAQYPVSWTAQSALHFNIIIQCQGHLCPIYA